jgi:hypothetical protein
MKINKLNKIMGVVFTLGMLLSMLTAFSGAVPASADTLAFSGDPALAGTGSSKYVSNAMVSYSVTADGKTIYGVSNGGSGVSTLYKSTNAGATWTSTGFTNATFNSPIPNNMPTASIVAVAPDDPTIVAFASNADIAGSSVPTVWVSTNSGATFTSITNPSVTPLAPTPWLVAGANPAGASISDIQISPAASGVHYIGIAGNTATAAAGKVGIAYYALGSGIGGWTDATGIAAGGSTWTASAAPAAGTLWAARAIRFSPNFASDRTFVALTEIRATAPGAGANLTVTAGSVYLQIANITTQKWDAAAGFPNYTGAAGVNMITTFPVGVAAPGANLPTNVAVQNATIALAPNYLGADSTTRIAFVGLATDNTVKAGLTVPAIPNTNGAGVFRFNDSTAKLISNAVRINSVAYNGTTLLAGDYDDNQVWNDSIDALSSSPTLTASSQFSSPCGTAPSTNTWNAPTNSATTGVSTPVATNSVYQVAVAFAGTTAVCSTQGAESAFSSSTDKGVTWKDVSFVKTNIYNVDDFGTSADGATLYYITDNGGQPAGDFTQPRNSLGAVGAWNASNGGQVSVVLGGQAPAIVAPSVTGNTGGVTSVTLTAAGAGYPAQGVGAHGEVVINTSVRFAAAAGHFGTGAAAVCTVTAGAISNITITNPGFGYDVPPVITFPNTAGVAGGATATAAITTAPMGTVVGMVVVEPGAGYTAAPTLTFGGGGGSGATAVVTIGVGGSITPAGVAWSGAVAVAPAAGSTSNQFVGVTAAGTGYAAAPSVTILGPGPTGGVGPTTFGSTAPGVTAFVNPAVSVWRYDGTAGWTRALAYNPGAGATGAVVKIAPDNAKTVYVGTVGTQNIYYTADGGNTWGPRITGGITAGSGIIQDIAVESASTLYYLTPGARVAQSTNNGFIWSTEVAAGSLSGAIQIWSLGAKNLVVASTTNSAAYSADSGLTWGTTAAISTSTGATVPVRIAASGVATGKAIYAIAPSIAGDFIYRFIIGGTAGWEKISPALNTIVLPGGALLPALTAMDITLDKSGALYVVAAETYNNAAAFDSFLFKTSDPTLAATYLTSVTTVAPAGVPTNWGVVTMGGTTNVPVIVTSGGLLTATVSSNPKVFATTAPVGAGGNVNNASQFPKGALLAFTDSVGAGAALTAPVSGSTVAVNPVTGVAYDVVYNWKRSASATSYTMQIAQDSAFNTLLQQISVTPVNPAQDPVAVVIGPNTAAPGGTTVYYQAGTTYYARVRVAGLLINSVLYNWFSGYGTATNFTVAPAIPVAPTPTPIVSLNSPSAGQTGVALTPTFSWDAVAGGNSYEIQVDTDPNFGAPVIKNNSVFSTAFVGTTALKNSTIYYWRVRATAGTIVGPWTAGVFTTTAPPAPSATQAPPPVTVIQQVTPPPSTPGYIWVIIGIGALLVIAVIILIMRTGRKA